MKVRNPKALAVSVLAVAAVVIFGSAFSTRNGWYERVRPDITPPDIVFPIVWTILYVLIAIAIYFAWVNSAGRTRKVAAILFAINLVANALWTPLFFGARMPIVAFVDLIVIWATALALIIYLWNISRVSSILLTPYFLWVSFAGVLNGIIAFGG